MFSAHRPRCTAMHVCICIISYGAICTRTFTACYEQIVGTEIGIIFLYQSMNPTDINRILNCEQWRVSIHRHRGARTATSARQLCVSNYVDIHFCKMIVDTL
jgi:hypothetical protein